MKKLAIFVALLLILALCACTPPVQEDLSSNSDSSIVTNTTITTDTQSNIATSTDTSIQGGLIPDPQPSNPQEPEGIESSLEALDKALSKAINGYESLTTQHDLIIVKENGTLTLGARLYKSTNDATYTSELINNLDSDFNSRITRKELRTLDDGFLGLDTIYGESYYLPQGDGWRRYEGRYFEESIFSFFALGNLRLHLTDITYDSERDIYTCAQLKSYSTIYNLEIKLKDNHLDYISYEAQGSYTGAKYEYHTLSFFNINETEITGLAQDEFFVEGDRIYYFENEELATFSGKTALFLAEYHYKNYLDKTPEDILSLDAILLGRGEYYIINLSGAKDTPGPRDDAEVIDLTYKISPEGEIISHEVSDWLPY